MDWGDYAGSDHERQLAEEEREDREAEERREEMRRKHGFPVTSDEAAAWKPLVWVYPLHSQVLCVAQTRIEGAWAAYCGPVPGLDHMAEYVEVLRVGNKLPEQVARALWPQLDEVPYAD